MLEGGLRSVLNFLGDFLKIREWTPSGGYGTDPAETPEAAAVGLQAIFNKNQELPKLCFKLAAPFAVN
jgi:hypothetical protein